MKGQREEQYQMHGALISANVFFGVGAVVGALGLPATHPLSFALIREFWAGLILLGISVYFYHQPTNCSNSSVDDQHEKKTLQPLWGWRVQWKTFWLLGLVVFGNQAGFIVGIKLAGPVAASVWRPSQQIFTTAICMALGWEPVIRKRLAGVLVACVGCVIMVLLKKHHDMANEQDTALAHRKHLIGNALFFMDCLCSSLYVILSKKMLKLYPALCVTAWSYNFAAVFMLVGALLASMWPDSNAFFCPDCPPESGVLDLPPAAVPALLYYIFFASVGSYGMITWANERATGTLVMSYTVIVPVTSVLLSTTLLAVGLVPNCNQKDLLEHQACLDFPTFGTFCGMVGVFGGLYLIISTEPKKEEEGEEGELEPLKLPLTTTKSAEGFTLPQ